MLSRVAMVEDKVNDMLAAIPADKREIDSLGCYTIVAHYYIQQPWSTTKLYLKSLSFKEKSL